MAKTVNNKGRSKGKTDHFTMMMRHTMECPAWKALGSTPQALYPWIKLEWRGRNANNNGKIQLSVRQAAERLGVTIYTASKAFHELQAKGFLVITRPARLGMSGAASSPHYEITELALHGAVGEGPRKLFLKWKEGHDFTVNKSMANNPSGKNGKKKPCPKNYDGNVIISMTKGKTAS